MPFSTSINKKIKTVTIKISDKIHCSSAIPGLIYVRYVLVAVTLLHSNGCTKSLGINDKTVFTFLLFLEAPKTSTSHVSMQYPIKECRSSRALLVQYQLKQEMYLILPSFEAAPFY